MSRQSDLLIEQEECDRYGGPAEERWTETCPHGYTVEHERCNIPGFRSHDVWTDCPECGRYRA